MAFIFWFGWVACSTTKNTGNRDSTVSLKPYIDYITKAYIPDKRTMLFNVQAAGNLLKGETISAEAKNALLNKLNTVGISFIDSINVLPSSDLQQKTFGVITISVANLRIQPSHKAELVSQATMATPVKIWKKQKGWYFVQTPDNYLAWVDDDAIQQMDATAFTQWQQKPKIIYIQPFGFAYETSNATSTISDLVYGDVLAVTATNNNTYEVQLPDGRKGFVLISQSLPYGDWKTSRQPSSENFVQTAKQLMGIPYLWGGTSFKGVDCSGFTKTIYFVNGLVLPRDASQQVMIGEEIDTKNGWQNLQPGDLLFFGSKAKGDSVEKVVHVGMWIGNNQFIHASGKVRITSFDTASPLYDEYELKRFLRAKRISPQTSLIDLRKKELF